MQIDFTDEKNYLTYEQKQLLRQILFYVAEVELSRNKIELSIAIVSDDEIKMLNNEYRTKNEVTDVLSFPLYNREEIISNDDNFLLPLGDIVISFSRAKEQAVSYGHSLERELAFLAVHGFLHLIGYTHDTKEEEMVMFTKQEQILKEFHLERR